ncbi:MAG: ParB/RepB/Spo0J family partition protein [Galactobacter sp.]
MTTTELETRTTVGTIVHLPLTQIRATGLNPRVIDEDDDFADLATLTRHQQHPIQVYPSPNVEGDVELVDGHRRLAAARRLGLDTLRCEIVDAPARDADLILDMVTCGTSGKDLTTSEIAAGIQGVLDLGVPMDEVKRRTGRGKQQDKTPYWQRTEGPQETLDTAFRLLEAREVLADDAEALKELDEVSTVANSQEQNRRLGNLLNDRTRKTVTAFLQDTDAEPTPAWRRYAFGVTPEYMDAAAYLDGDPVEVDADITARVEAGHTWEVMINGQVKWTSPVPEETEDDDETAQGPTPEEIAAEQAQDQAAEDLATIHKVTTECLVDEFRQKSPLASLAAHKVLQGLALDQVTDSLRGDAEYRRLLLAVLGLPDTRDSDQWEEHIVAPARKVLATKTWEWLVAFLDLDNFEAGLYGMGQLVRCKVGFTENAVWDVVSKLESRYGLNVGVAKDRLKAWLHPEPQDDVTAECEDCGQTVAKDPDWEGVCMACSPGVEDE